MLSLVSLFADMTYEGARSITGPYLSILGANAATVGFVAGFGEFVGYGLRILSGYWADQTRQYWFITILGYICNLLAVPLLALAGHWWIAAVFIILERTGKAIRVPPRDAMLSHAGQMMGMGWVFGLHEAIDQIGAMSGPLIVAGVLYFKHSYRESFAVLLIPALIALSILAFAKWLYPKPQTLEVKHEQFEVEAMQTNFWVYLIGAAFVAMGYADFPLIAYHFEKQSILSSVWIPISYAFAMGVNSIAAPFLGHFYDKKGLIILIMATLVSCIFAPLVFLGNASMAFIGVALWSIGIGAHESLMRAIVANMTPKNKRASAYGIFNTGFGISWFLGSVLMGIIYDISIPALVIFSVLIQLLAIPFLWVVMKRMK